MSNYIGSSNEAMDFLHSIHVRDRLIAELTDALERMLQQFGDHAQYDEWDAEAVEVARNALTKVSGAQA